MSAHVHIGMNESQLHNQTEALRKRILILSLSVTLLGILLGTFMIRRITNPLSRLADSMHAFGKGEAEEEIGFSGGGQEVEELTLAFNRMISERKRAEKALRESEENLSIFTEVFGWTMDELKGQRIPFVPDEQKEIIAAKIKEIYALGKTARIETQRLTKQGDTIDFRASWLSGHISHKQCGGFGSV